MATSNQRTRDSIWHKLADTVGGVIFPTVCFLMARDLGPGWQDGNLSTYVLLFLDQAGTTLFLPLLVPAVAALLLVVWFPATAGFGLVRCVVLTGLPLAAQYGFAFSLYLLADLLGLVTAAVLSVICGGIAMLPSQWILPGLCWLRTRAALLAVAACSGLALTGSLLVARNGWTYAIRWLTDLLGLGVSIVLGCVCVGVVMRLPHWILRGLRWLYTRVGWLGVVVGLGLALGPLLASWWIEWPTPFVVLFWGVVLGVLLPLPFWTFRVFLRRVLAWQTPSVPAGRSDVRELSAPTSRAATWSFGGAWLVSWIVSWRVAVARVLADYADLPLDPPSCFLATVAARGHAGLVRSVRCSVAGVVFPVTVQLRRFKAFEVVLAWRHPALHRALRKAYDAVGPAVASRLRFRWQSDLMWLLLKPLELAASATVLLAAKDADRHIARIWPTPTPEPSPSQLRVGMEAAPSRTESESHATRQTSVHGPSRVGSATASATASRNRSRDHSTAPRRFRWGVVIWQSRKAKPHRSRRVSNA